MIVLTQWIEYLFQMAQGNFALFCTHAANMGAYFQHLVLVLLVRDPLFQSVCQMTKCKGYCKKYYKELFLPDLIYKNNFHNLM